MIDRVTRRVLLLGSAGALAAYAIGEPRRRRTLTGVRIGRQAGALDVTFLRDGARAVAADTTPEGRVNLWDLRARKIARSFRVGRRLRCVAFDEQRRLYVVASRIDPGGASLVAALDFATGREVRRIGEAETPYGVHRLLVAREGLVTSLEDRGQPLPSKLWSFDTGRRLASYLRPAEALSADRRSVLGGRVIWDIRTERTRGELPSRSPTFGVALSSDGSRAVSEQRGAGILWNERGELMRRFDDQPAAIARAAFSPDDRFLITARYPGTFGGDRRLLVLRDGRSGRWLADLPGHGRFVSAVAFSPDSASALSVGLEGEVILWTMPR